MSDTTDVDLFGNPVDRPTSTPSTLRELTNDMDLIQSILADVTDEKTPPLHHDAFDSVRRCGTGETTPVSAEFAAAVTQLVAARYLTTTRRGCTNTGHGPVITITPTGRAAVCRWRAYRRPASWDSNGSEGNR